MDLEEKWEKALSQTEVVRSRAAHLNAFEASEIPYIFLAESTVNIPDTVVRKGKILLHQPAIILPQNMPLFEGFEFEQDYQASTDTIKTFLYIRGVSFPSLKYKHEFSQLDIYEDPLKKAKEYFKRELERVEDVHTGLIIGSEDCWQFSLLIYAGILISKFFPSDLKKLWERFKDKK